MQSLIRYRRTWRAGLVGIASGLLLLTTIAAAPVGAQSPAAGDVTLTSATASGITGNFLAGKDGMTLYFFTLDGVGTSNCTGKCAGIWPPLVVTKGQKAVAGDGVSGVIGTIKRADGADQVTFDGRPLYYFSKDTKAGDVNGQGVAEVWFVAMADGSVPPAPIYTIALGSGNAASYLTGEDSMTLYYYAKDTTPGVATCTGDCATKWPPYLPGPRDVLMPGPGVTGVIGLATQADGSKQATYDGRPLYYFSGDKAAGDVNGQGIGGVWFAATVDGSLSAAAPQASGSPAPEASAPASSTAPEASAPASSAAPEASASAGAVSIKNLAFAPGNLDVAVGTTVTWTNGDGFAHTVTADDGSFDSGDVSGGATFSQTFTTAGTFAYHCKIHSSMHGTITVH